MKSGMYPNDKEKIMKKPFTNKEINELLTARIRGKRHAEIAASLGRTPKSIRQKMYALDKKAPLPTTLAELAENFDVWAKRKPTGRPKKSLKSLNEILDGWDEADEPTKEVTVQAFKDPNLTDEEVAQVFKKPPTGKIWAKPNHRSPNATTNSRGNIAPPAAKTKAKTKPVKTKSQQPAVKATGNLTVATGNDAIATGNDAFVIRIPKVYVWVVITASLMAAAWYVGKTY
jgi:hypothetical protein